MIKAVGENTVQVGVNDRGPCRGLVRRRRRRAHLAIHRRTVDLVEECNETGRRDLRLRHLRPRMGRV